jgi:hypothetical protein
VKCAETLRDKLPLAKPFDAHCERQAIDPAPDFSAHTGDGGGMYRLNRCVPLAHEDKTPAIKTRLFTRQKALALGSRERGRRVHRQGD